MSEDEAPKTAFEIAMEKLRARGGFEEKKLTDDQKAEIAEVRSRYRAHIAQLEIESASKLENATSLEELEQLKAEVASEKQRLSREEEEKVEKIREG